MSRNCCQESALDTDSDRMNKKSAGPKQPLHALLADYSLQGPTFHYSLDSDLHTKKPPARLASKDAMEFHAAF